MNELQPCAVDLTLIEMDGKEWKYGPFLFVSKYEAEQWAEWFENFMFPYDQAESTFIFEYREPTAEEMAIAGSK
jgi:hypothetical protein